MESHEAKVLVRDLQRVDPAIFNIQFHELEGMVGLAQGNFGEVYVAKYKGQNVAVKKLLDVDDENMHKYLKREMMNLKYLDHPNIVSFFGLCKHHSGLYIATEFIDGGDLRHILKNKEIPLSWTLRAGMAVDVAAALAYLHSREVVHRDLKSNNVLVTREGIAKVCDFGFSRKINPGAHMTVCGTDQWMAPEILMGEQYDHRADVFSFGMVLTELITREKPKERDASKGFAFDFDNWVKVQSADTPQALIQIVKECCQYDPEKRPEFSEILAKLQAVYEYIKLMEEKAVQDGNSKKEKENKEKEKKSRKNSSAKNLDVPTMPSPGKSSSSKSPRGNRKKKAELCLKVGDIITILQKDENGWAEGVLENGRRGWFPLTYVEAPDITPLGKVESAPKIETIPITSEEKKQNVRKSMKIFLENRPTADDLQNRNILISSPDVERREAETKKKQDLLSKFLRKKSKDKKLDAKDFTDSQLDDLTILLTQKIATGPTKVGKQTYEKSFSGSALIEAISGAGLTESSSHAKQLGQILLDRQYLEDVSEPVQLSASNSGNNLLFKDKKGYRLKVLGGNTATNGVIVNNGKKWSSTSRNPLVVVEELLKDTFGVLNKFKSVIEEWNGGNARASPQAIRQSSSFLTLLFSSCELQTVDVSSLDVSSRRLFFINCYNLLNILAHTMYGPPVDTDETREIMDGYLFIINNMQFSLRDIKNKVLLGISTFPEDDVRKKTEIPSSQRDPFVVFALSDNNKSTPPAIIYTKSGYNEQLKQSIVNFLASTVITTEGTMELRVPAIVDRFAQLLPNQKSALASLEPYLSPDVKNFLAKTKEKQKDDSSVTLTVQCDRYDFTPYFLLKKY